jgi:hypothetical protein
MGTVDNLAKMIAQSPQLNSNQHEKHKNVLLLSTRKKSRVCFSTIPKMYPLFASAALSWMLVYFDLTTSFKISHLAQLHEHQRFLLGWGKFRLRRV